MLLIKLNFNTHKHFSFPQFSNKKKLSRAALRRIVCACTDLSLDGLFFLCFRIIKEKWHSAAKWLNQKQLWGFLLDMRKRILENATCICYTVLSKRKYVYVNTIENPTAGTCGVLLYVCQLLLFFTIQPLANIVSNYTCHDGEVKGKYVFHVNTPLSVVRLGATTKTLYHLLAFSTRKVK